MERDSSFTSLFGMKKKEKLTTDEENDLVSRNICRWCFHGVSFNLSFQVNELRAAIGPLSDRLSRFCTDSCLRRYLRARNWNLKKAENMLKDTLKWRGAYKPEEIQWVDPLSNSMNKDCFIYAVKLSGRCSSRIRDWENV